MLETVLIPADVSSRKYKHFPLFTLRKPYYFLITVKQVLKRTENYFYCTIQSPQISDFRLSGFPMGYGPYHMDPRTSQLSNPSIQESFFPLTFNYYILSISCSDDIIKFRSFLLLFVVGCKRCMSLTSCLSISKEKRKTDKDEFRFSGVWSLLGYFQDMI